jgi:putative membrane protein
MKSPRDWSSLIAKGFAMGAADLVPGVSGGTIAFITGIYTELISTIAALGPETVKDLFSDGPVAVWKKYNFNFLLALVIGIAISVVVLSGTIHMCQTTYPTELRSFFLGLVIASTPLIARSISGLSRKNILSALIGLTLALILTSLPPAVQSDSPIFLALSGAIAISAMLLPGISGSFILLILGAYSPVIAAIAGYDFIRIFSFAGGVLIGLLVFSRLLSRILKNYRNATLSLLVGVMLGSLPILWPWKENVEELYTHSDGRIEWLTTNILPQSTAGEIAVIVLFALVGATLVIALDKFSQKR